MALCVLLLSRYISFSRFIHAVACIPLYSRIIFHCVYSIYPFISWWYFSCFHFGVFRVAVLANIPGHILYEHQRLLLWWIYLGVDLRSPAAIRCLTLWGTKCLPQWLRHFHSHLWCLRVAWKVLSKWGKHQMCALKQIAINFCERVWVRLGLLALTCLFKHSSGNVSQERLRQEASQLGLKILRLSSLKHGGDSQEKIQNAGKDRLGPIF